MTRYTSFAVCSLLASQLCAQELPEPVATRQIAFVVPPATDSSAALPHDGELQRRGARIGRIDVHVDEVFETAQQLAAPYRLANGLHIATREATVSQQLLFRSGDVYDRRLLEETERLLRSQRYFNAASIRPVRYNRDNTVDVAVRVHDVWTLSPGISFGRKGGTNSVRFEVEDTNFLGYGKQISLSRVADVDRSAWRLAYVDPNLLGSRWRLSGVYGSLSDGTQKELTVSRPFYSLDSRWACNVSGVDTAAAISHYALGHSIGRIDMRERELDLGGGISTGLRDGWVRRFLAGVRYESRAFSAHTPGDTAALPQDRTFAYPWLGIELIEDEYLATRNLDQIGRVEDLYLGRSARLTAGLAARAFGSTSDALMLSGELQAGTVLASEQYLINALELDGRLDGGRLDNTVLELSSRYYLRQTPRRVFFAGLSTTLAANLDAQEQLLLGGDSGLRGYPLRYQAGTARALLTLEQRFYTSWQPLKLVDVGAALFFDAGRTWGADPYAPPPLGWLKDVGFGLRLGSARSGLGNVLHVDLAFPLDGPSDIDSVQLLIETRRSF